MPTRALRQGDGAKSRAAYWGELDAAVTADRAAHGKTPLPPKDRQRARFGFDVRAVGLDTGYASAPIAKGLEERDVLGVTGYLRPSGPKGMLHKRAFQYDAEADVYRCPEGQFIPYATTDRNGYRHHQRKGTKTVIRHVWADARGRVDAHRLTYWGKRLYKRRKETVERSFADAKQLFGHRYARFRSLAKVQTQALLAATAQNIKKIAMAMWKGAPQPA